MFMHQHVNGKQSWARSHESWVMLSKNRNSSEHHAQSKNWYFVMYPSWKQCRSCVKVVSNFGSLWLVHDFLHHFLDGYMTKYQFFDWAWQSLKFHFYWELWVTSQSQSLHPNHKHTTWQSFPTTCEACWYAGGISRCQAQHQNNL